MVSIRINDEFPVMMVEFLKHCYRFVNEQWSHEPHDDSADQGFERTFRSRCVTQLSGWEISQPWELGIGYSMMTSSGVLHEIDMVAKHPDVTAITELKNRQSHPGKNDVVILFAKMLDYLSANPDMLLKELCPIFMSTSSFDQTGLEACLGLGIHPVGPGLRPIPILIDNARRIAVEIQTGAVISGEVADRFSDYCAELNSTSLSLSDSWTSSRFGYRSQNTIVVKSVAALEVSSITYSIRHLNGECNYLLSAIREAKR